MRRTAVRIRPTTDGLEGVQESFRRVPRHAHESDDRQQSRVGDRYRGFDAEYGARTDGTGSLSVRSKAV
ncbi:hypothetical protein D8Y22_06935 [Salinadaptatus halalkaliphilus]|uniref:Uncharacterized protein n=1 Tax=Salinadaptatus halalkaliphilus TaxID=2419781 RepID=A0A4S3TMP7_9EURY|nr:hypothetical protein D8Y22_06935 [Salinadaptatus halalkaliphilus]